MKPSWLMLVVGCLAFTARAAAADFEQANTLFDQQKYPEALAAYAEVEKSGVHTANLSYNLGNTEFRLGSPGRAILQYERALAHDPSHPEAQANLALLRSQTGAQLLPVTWADRLVPPWRADFFAIAGAVAAWAMILGGVGLVLGPARHRGGWGVLVAGALLLGAWAGVVIWRTEGRAARAIVLEPAAEARTRPEDRAATVVPLPAGSQVQVLWERGSWTYCELPQSRRGWLHTSALERIAEGSSS